MFGCPSKEAVKIFGCPPAAGKISIILLPDQRGGLSLTTMAIDWPSGEKVGADSAAGVPAKSVTLPLATSTIETSAVVQSLATCDRVWLKTPTGAQLNVQALVTERVGPDTCWMPFHFAGRWQGDK